LWKSYCGPAAWILSLRSRKIHFLSWCHDVGFPDHCTPELPLQGHNWIITCYAVALIHGRTITGVCIRHVMLLGYIKQAVALHTDCGLPNPHQVDINYIKIMTNAVKKYKTGPKCNEMISDIIFHYIANLASCASEDSLLRAITDWIALGCYTSFCKSMQCSDNHKSFATIDDPNWGDLPNVLPIITEDFIFSSATGHWVHDVNATPNDAITFA
jgi:hypothetical protein